MSICLIIIKSIVCRINIYGRNKTYRNSIMNNSILKKTIILAVNTQTCIHNTRVNNNKKRRTGGC